MTALLIRDQIINLDHVVSVKFQANDPEVSHDDRCSISFVNTMVGPLEIYGEDAKETYEKIAKAMGVSLS